MLIGGCDDFLVANGSPRLDDCRDPSRGGVIHTIAEGEKRVGAKCRSDCLMASAVRLVYR